MRDKKGHLYLDKDRDSNQQPNKMQLSLSDKLTCEEKNTFIIRNDLLFRVERKCVP